jgi:DNA-binding Lrp family transcriptional regulator
MKTFLAIETAPGAIESVRETIRNSFVELEPVQIFGEYDLFTFIDDKSIETPYQFYDKYIVPISAICEDSINATETFHVLKTNRDHKRNMNSEQISANILISIRPHLGSLVFSELEEMTCNPLVSLCTGSFDGVVEVEAKSIAEVSDIVDEIHTIPGVRKTVTCIIKKP